MIQYYCYLLNEEGQIKARGIVEGIDDADAIGKARTYMAAHPAIPAVELWRESVCVDRLSQNAA